MESVLSLWLAEREGADQKLLEDIFISVAEEQKDRATQRKTEPCVEHAWWSIGTLGLAICSAWVPSLSHFKLGISFGKQKKRENRASASNFLPNDSAGFGISRSLWAGHIRALDHRHCL